MDDASIGVEMRRSVRPGLLEGWLQHMHFLFSHFIASSLIRLSIHLANECIFVSLVDLDGGVLIINYSMTARVVDNGEVIEDTKELRKRFY